MDTDKPYYCYVLWSDDAGRFYIGVTEDVEKRAEQHNAGQNRWTGNWEGWEVVWCERRENLGAARKLENRLKRQKGGDGFYSLTGLDPEDFSSSGS